MITIKPKILLTNDDGVTAKGINLLFEEISSIADITIVAPSKEQSAVGHAVSISNNLLLTPIEKENKIWGYSLDGTPADCVKFAITHLLKDTPPDFVISGINAGLNAGNSVLYSGTVAAAIEAAMFGIPAIAVSLAIVDRDAPQCSNYGLAVRFVRRILPILLEKKLPKGVILNINVPDIPDEELRGVVISRQGTSMFVDVFEQQGEYGGVIAYKNIGKKMIYTEHNCGEDFDDYVLHNKKISITPLQYDLTHHNFLQELKNWIENKEMPDISKELKELSSNIGAVLE